MANFSPRGGQTRGGGKRGRSECQEGLVAVSGASQQASLVHCPRRLQQMPQGQLAAQHTTAQPPPNRNVWHTFTPSSRTLVLFFWGLGVAPTV